MATAEIVEGAKQSLLRIQSFDVQSLAREDDLGRQLSFAKAVPLAAKIVALYRRVPVEILDDLTDPLLQQMRGQADADFNRFKSILDFSASQGNAAQVRESLLAQIDAAYDAAFNALWQYIAFGVARLTDTAVLENQARAVLQGIDDSSKKFQATLAGSEQEAQRILQNIKAVAAEQGVSQQAEFFKARADEHVASALEWRNHTLLASAILLAIVVASLFTHRWEWISPKNNFEIVQFVTSKIFLFAVVAYWVVLAAKNFLSHQHNAVVNRHRQTALQTYRVLADAAGGEGTEDIVLAHASACIFGPQDTGFTKGTSTEGGSRSILELLTKATPSGSHS
jgi:hypothetical protein